MYKKSNGIIETFAIIASMGIVFPITLNNVLIKQIIANINGKTFNNQISILYNCLSI